MINTTTSNTTSSATQIIIPSFVTYSIPYIEFRRRISTAYIDRTIAYTTYTNNIHSNSLHSSNNSSSDSNTGGDVVYKEYYVLFSINNNDTLLLYNSTTGLVYYTNSTSSDYESIHKSAVNSNNSNNISIHDNSMRHSGRPLHTPLSWWENIIYRFRSFDGAYSPCRH